MELAFGRFKADIAASAGLLLVLLAALLLFWPSAWSIWVQWRNNQTYSHGFLVAAGTAFWILLGLRARTTVRPVPSSAGLLALLTTLVVWLIGYRSNLDILHQVLLPLVMLAAIAAAAGPSMAKPLVLPILFLYFSIPFWDHLLPPLQQLSIAVTEFTLEAVGIPAQIEGDRVTIPSGVFEIAEGCAGLRYLVVALALAYVGAAMQGLDLRRTVLLFAVAASLSLVVNWARILVIIYAGHLTGMEHYFIRVEHNSLGLALFAPIMAGVALSARWLAQEPRIPSAPDGRAERFARGTEARPAWAPIVVVMLMMAGVAWLAQSERAAKASAGLAPLPLAAGPWMGPYPPSDAWRPAFASPSAESRAAYVDSASLPVEVYVNYYSSQRRGAELVSHLNSMLSPGRWERVADGSAVGLSTTNGPPLSTIQARTADGKDWLVAYTYTVAGTVTEINGMAAIAYGLRSIIGAAPAGVVALAVQCTPDCDGARRAIGAFWSEFSDRLISMIPTDGGFG